MFALASLFPGGPVLWIFAAGCALTMHGIVLILVLLDKPAGWFCHVRGIALIALFVVSAIGLCGAVFERVAPSTIGALHTLLIGILCVLYAVNLRRQMIRHRSLRGRALLNRGGEK